MHGFPGTDTVVEVNGHVGHGAVLHGCIVKRNAMVGMNAVVMDEAVIGESSIVAACAFVKAGMVIAPRSLAAGVPAKVLRPLTDEEIEWKQGGTRTYQELAVRSDARCARWRRSPPPTRTARASRSPTTWCRKSRCAGPERPGAERKMLKTFRYPKYEYRRPAELDGTPPRRPVIVVGAGPVGMAAAIDLRQHGVPVLLLDDDDTVSIGSRGVCYAKRRWRSRPARHRRRGLRQGRQLGRRPHLLPRARGLPLQPAPAARPQAAGHDQPAAVLPRADAGRALRRRRRRDALEEQGRRGAGHRRGAELQVETPDGAYASTATGWSSPTARAARSATCSAWTSRARSSPTAS
jgi:hypothetical protein